MNQIIERKDLFKSRALLFIYFEKFENLFVYFCGDLKDKVASRPISFCTYEVKMWLFVSDVVR